MTGYAEGSNQGRARAIASKGAPFSTLKGAPFGLEPAPAVKKAQATARRKAPQFIKAGVRA